MGNDDYGVSGMRKERGVLTAYAVVTAAGLVIIGLLKGQNVSVWEKAVRICLECIGIG